MSKNLAKQYESTPTHRNSTSNYHHHIELDTCDECGAELYQNKCLDCEDRELKKQVRRKRATS
jgi:hypothetical protein